MANAEVGSRTARTKSEKKAEKKALKTAKKSAGKAHTRDSLQALSKLAEHVDGNYRIISQPPVVIPARELAPTIGMSQEQFQHVIHEQFRAYRATLQPIAASCWSDSRSSTSTQSRRCRQRRHTRIHRSAPRTRPGRSLFLQVKEATTSVLEDHLPKSIYKQHGERVVQGQRLMQAASDIFLGWTKGAEENRYLYWRQLRDMKGSAVIEGMAPFALAFYGRQCGWTLARAHARSAIQSRSPPISAKTTSSTSRSPTSRGATPTRTSRTTTPSAKPSTPIAWPRPQAFEPMAAADTPMGRPQAPMGDRRPCYEDRHNGARRVARRTSRRGGPRRLDASRCAATPPPAWRFSHTVLNVEGREEWTACRTQRISRSSLPIRRAPFAGATKRTLEGSAPTGARPATSSRPMVRRMCCWS